jgi:hypothetical protein
VSENHKEGSEYHFQIVVHKALRMSNKQA